MHAKLKKISKYRPSVFQARLNLAEASAKPHVALAVEYPVERRILQALIGALIVLALGYFYFVSESVLNIMAQRTADNQSAQIQASIGSLENNYFALSQAITPQEGSDLGLVQVSVSDYVTRPTDIGIADSIPQNQI